MKKLLLSALFLLCATLAAQAQHPYVFSVTTAAYTPLTGGTSVNNNDIWYDTSTFVVPVGFTYKMGGITANTLTMTDASFISPGATGIQSGFGVLSASIQDRNVGKTTSRSPVRYTTTGTAGSRIFKLEVYNAGFTEEGNYNTDLDSISFQVWIYEQNSAVELHYGPSRVSHFADYFGLKVTTGYIKNLNTNTFSFDQAYVLTGNPAAPAMDSMSTFDPGKGLNTLPGSGTVYRYVPRTAASGVGNTPKSDLARVYPTLTGTVLHIDQAAGCSYSILGANGTLIRQGTITDSHHTEDVSALIPGAYFLRLNKQHEWDSKSFIRQ